MCQSDPRGCFTLLLQVCSFGGLSIAGELRHADAARATLRHFCLPVTFRLIYTSLIRGKRRTVRRTAVQALAGQFIRDPCRNGDVSWQLVAPNGQRSGKSRSRLDEIPCVEGLREGVMQSHRFRLGIHRCRPGFAHVGTPVESSGDRLTSLSMATHFSRSVSRR
jgi:hypothetical protein